VFGVIPVSRELIWSPYKNGTAFDGKSFSRLKPRLEGLIGELLTGAVEEAFPDFCGAERHDTLPYPVYVEKSNKQDVNSFTCLELSSMLE
jgi:hypothetical protein